MDFRFQSIILIASALVLGILSGLEVFQFLGLLGLIAGIFVIGGIRIGLQFARLSPIVLRPGILFFLSAFWYAYGISIVLIVISSTLAPT